MIFKDATEMAQAVREGRVSPSALVRDTIKKAQALNPELNAITSERFSEALAEAAARDFFWKAICWCAYFSKGFRAGAGGPIGHCRISVI